MINYRGALFMLFHLALKISIVKYTQKLLRIFILSAILFSTNIVNLSAMELNEAYQIYLQRLFEGSLQPPVNSKGQVEQNPELIIIRDYLKALRQEDRTRVLKDAKFSLKKIARIIRERATQKQIRRYYEMQRAIELSLTQEQEALDQSLQGLQKMVARDVRPLNHPLIYQEWLPQSINQAVVKAQQNNADVLVAQNILEAATEAARGFRGAAFEPNYQAGGDKLSQPIENLFQARLRYRDVLQQAEKQISVAWLSLEKVRQAQQGNVKKLNENIKIRDEILGKLYEGHHVIENYLNQEELILQMRLHNLVSHYDHFFAIYFMLKQTGELTPRLAPALNSTARLQIDADSKRAQNNRTQGQIPLVPENNLLPNSPNSNRDNRNNNGQVSNATQTPPQALLNNLDMPRNKDVNQTVLSQADKFPAEIMPSARDLGRAAADYVKKASVSKQNTPVSQFKKINQNLVSGCRANDVMRGNHNSQCQDDIGEEFLQYQQAKTDPNRVIDSNNKPKYAPKLNSSLQQASIKQALINDESDNGLDNEQFAFAIDLPQKQATPTLQNNANDFQFTSANQALASAQPTQQQLPQNKINQGNNAKKLPFADPNYNPQFAGDNIINANQNNMQTAALQAQAMQMAQQSQQSNITITNTQANASWQQPTQAELAQVNQDKAPIAAPQQQVEKQTLAQNQTNKDSFPEIELLERQYLFDENYNESDLASRR